MANFCCEPSQCYPWKIEHTGLQMMGQDDDEWDRRFDAASKPKWFNTADGVAIQIRRRINQRIDSYQLFPQTRAFFMDFYPMAREAWMDKDRWTWDKERGVWGNIKNGLSSLRGEFRFHRELFMAVAESNVIPAALVDVCASLYFLTPFVLLGLIFCVGITSVNMAAEEMERVDALQKLQDKVKDDIQTTYLETHQGFFHRLWAPIYARYSYPFKELKNTWDMYPPMHPVLKSLRLAWRFSANVFRANPVTFFLTATLIGGALGTGQIYLLFALIPLILVGVSAGDTAQSMAHEAEVDRDAKDAESVPKERRTMWHRFFGDRMGERVRVYQEACKWEALPAYSKVWRTMVILFTAVTATLRAAPVMTTTLTMLSMGLITLAITGTGGFGLIPVAALLAVGLISSLARGEDISREFAKSMDARIGALQRPDSDERKALEDFGQFSLDAQEGETAGAAEELAPTPAPQPDPTADDVIKKAAGRVEQLCQKKHDNDAQSAGAGESFCPKKDTANHAAKPEKTFFTSNDSGGKLTTGTPKSGGGKKGGKK